MKAATQKYGVKKNGDRYIWTPLTHSELVDFIESRRLKSNLSKQALSVAANFSVKTYTNVFSGHARFSKASFAALAKAVIDAQPKQLSIPIDQQPEKIQASAKNKDHRFSDSIYAMDVDLFIEHWNQTETAKAYPEIDPFKVYKTLKTSSEATIKYTYSNWMAAAQNWVKRNPNEYKKIEAPTKIEKPIYGVMSIEQMITKIKAAGYKVMRRTEGWEEI
jgi:hypothetical protein